MEDFSNIRSLSPEKGKLSHSVISSENKKSDFNETRQMRNGRRVDVFK